MRVRRFGSSLAFAALSAVAFVFAQLALASIVGSARVWTLHLTTSLVGYAFCLGTTPRRSVRGALVALVGAGVVVALARDLGELALGLTLVLAVVRTALEPATRNAPAFLLEGCLGVVALGFAGWLGSPTWLGGAAAIWGFALVQSLHPLLGSVLPRRLGGRDGPCRAGTDPIDPFDRARAGLLALLDDG